MQILIKRKVDGPSVPELGTPTSVTFESITVPLNRASTGPAALAQYELQRSLDGSTWSTIATGPSIFGNPPVQFVDGGRIALTTYYYRARALDVAGRASGYSATVSATTAATIAPSTALVFPRTCTINNGAPQAYNQLAYQQAAAQFDVALWGLWETWAQGRTATPVAGAPTSANAFVQSCANLKTLNPNIKLFVYFNAEASSSLDSSIRPVARAAINSNNWWARASFPAGAILTITAYGDSFQIPNQFPGGPLLNGQTYNEWAMSTYVRDMYVNGAYPQYFTANPHIDGFFQDNVYMMYGRVADRDRDGVADAENNLALGTAYRQSIAAGVAAYRALLPGKAFFANNMLGTMQYNPWNLPAPPPEYAGLFDFGLNEFFTGESWSGDEWGNAQTVLEGARKHALQCNDPSNVVTYSTRRYNLTSTNFQDCRYALAGQLCASNGYVQYSDTGGDNASGSRAPFEGPTKWWDEYGNYGTLPRYYLGTAEDPVVTAPWASGVYRRRFQNGWVLWNPRGNGVRTVNLGQTMRKLQGRSGFSDTTVNNGAQVTSVTLQDRDGLFLLKP